MNPVVLGGEDKIKGLGGFGKESCEQPEPLGGNKDIRLKAVVEHV